MPNPDNKQIPNVYVVSFRRRSSLKGLPVKYDSSSQRRDNMPILARLLDNYLRITNDVGRGMMAEFAGTFILMVFGQGVVAQVVLSKQGNGEYLSINIGWAMAVMFGVMVSGGVSGGHLNPAVTVTLIVMKKCNFKRGFLYIVTQYLAAFTASFIIYVIYYDALVDFAGDARDFSTGGIFATFPQDFLTWHGALADQIFGTALLMLGILAITDPENMKIPTHLVPFHVGLLVLTIGMCFGYNCGYAINPARDLGPRMFIAVAGWGEKVFSLNGYNYFWIPVVGPHLGALLGAVIYTLFISNHWPRKSDDSERDTITGVFRSLEEERCRPI